MAIVTYEIPIISQDDFKPSPMANQSFPYNNVSSDRRFEELLYSIYKIKIEKGDFFNQFDSISLMTGVRDKGRDCALIKNGKNHGLIQCKKYASNYVLDEFGKEITQFALYAIAEPSLIFDKNDFTYYIAVSTNFDFNCNEFIGNFNENILSETKLDKWIAAGLTKASLKLLALTDQKPTVLEILKKIKVKKILPQDLDKELIQPYCRHLQSLFFEVRTVIDNSPVEKLSKKIEDYFDNNLSADQLLTQLKRASGQVNSQRNVLEGIPESHITRVETERLFNWVSAPSQKDKEDRDLNICLLAANAGMGKTVIIKDLYDKLLAENIPVLALKADRLFSSDLVQLQQKIGLTLPVYEFIDHCIQKFPKLIILIDQIDALSQSLSADRSAMNTFIQLVEAYRFNESVRIIIAVRLFDLSYDPSLKIYKTNNTIEVQKLSKDEVTAQVAKLGLGEKELSANLCELLQVPNNLDVFSRVFSKGTSFAGVNSVQDLYAELWKLKITMADTLPLINVKSLIHLLYRIAYTMFERQQITINKDVFSEYQRELNYLQAEQLLVLENNEISFFHQSFYDYVYAKDFVESKRSLEKYIENSGQSLLIRSAVKMILNYQREFDHDLYIRQLKLSLRKRNVAFHIKHLIVSGLSVEAKPSIKEKHLFSKVISKNRELLNVFYEHTRSTLWLEYLEAKGYLQALVKTNKDAEERILIRGLKKFQNLFKKNKRADVTTSTELNTCFHLMVRNLPDARNVAVRFFSGIDNENLISRILYNLKIWDSQESFVLLEKYPGIMKISNWVYYPILEDILYYNADYVLEKIKPTLLLQKEEHQHGYSEHGRKELLQKLLKKKPCELMDYLFGIIESELKEKSYKYDENIFLSDWIFNDVQIYAQDDNYLDGLKYFYYLLADGLRQQAAEESNWFRAFLTTNIQSRYKAVLRLLIYAIVTNEKIYTTETIELLSYLHINSFLDSTGKLNFELRNLIRGSYSHFNNNQSRVILDIMRKINGKREIGVWKDSEGRKHIHRWWGITQFHFLNIVPENILKQDLKLFRRWQELHRKFKGQKDNNGSSARGGVVGPPLKAGAYKHMDDKSWINSFRKYYSDSSGRSSSMDDDFLKGGITEHSRAFCEAVKNNPSRFMQLIDTIIDDQSIPVDYAIKGIEGIQASEILLDSISPFLVRVIQRGVSNFNIHACIWIIKRLDDGKVLNNVLLDFLIHESLHNPDPTPERITQIEQHNQTIDSMLQAGINTARGAAANALVTLNEKIYEEEIFQTLEIIFEKDIAIVKVPPLNYFAYLMNINQDRAFDFFTKIITSEKNSDILTAGIWSMQYLIHYDFSRLVGYFRKLISKDDLTENEVRNLTTILFASWLNDYPGAEDLFKTFLKRHEGSHSAALHNCFDFFYFKSEVSQKTIKILEYLLNEAEKKVIKRFEAEFRSMDKIAFLDVYPFLLKYVVSSVFNISDYFLEYLIRHCYNYPVECIGLFEMAIDNDHLESEDGENYFRENDSITKFIIGAYTVLRPSHIDSHRMYQKKLLNAFDKILKNPRFRTNTEKVLERIIG